MDLNVQKFGAELVRKHVIQFKGERSDGLILKLHNILTEVQKANNVTRFVHASFDKTGSVLAAADGWGRISFVDLARGRFWTLRTVTSCTSLAFSWYNEKEVIIGTSSGKVCVVYVDTGEVTAELAYHKTPVSLMSFCDDGFHVVTSSKSEGAMWDLRTNSRVMILNVQPGCGLKLIKFVPVTNHVIACFDDDTIDVWKKDTLEPIKQIVPSPANRLLLRCIAFTRNGRAMVFGGHAPILTVFALDLWQISKTFSLAGDVRSIKRLEFVPQLFDGGANKILLVLSGSGTVWFYDMEQDALYAKLPIDREVVSLECSIDGRHVACIARSGEVFVYRLATYVPEMETQKNKAVVVSEAAIRRDVTKARKVTTQLNEVLDITKLRSILSEFGQYPDEYRKRIWSRLLQLPRNRSAYASLSNRIEGAGFDELERRYPLEDKMALRTLKRALCDLVAWCPHFGLVDYLPLFVFPFVRMFRNDCVGCFETLATILTNWCQNWFEYHPLLPINTLAMIENVLQDSDPQLLLHLTSSGVTSQTYAWPLLETAFSEVLRCADWRVLWDHILSNEPSFLLLSVVSYNIANRSTILTLSAPDEFQAFYRNVTPINTKKLIGKTYGLLESVPGYKHPKRYLNDFVGLLGRDGYPRFVGFPKEVAKMEMREVSVLERESKAVGAEAEEILKLCDSKVDLVGRYEMEDVDRLRLSQAEAACRDRIVKERDRVRDQRSQLADLSKQVFKEQAALLKKSRLELRLRDSESRRSALKKAASDIRRNRDCAEAEAAKTEAALTKHYSKLLAQKMKIEEILNENRGSDGGVGVGFERRVLEKHQRKLAEELTKLRSGLYTEENLRQLNVMTGIAALDCLIKRLEAELAKEVTRKASGIDADVAKRKVVRLQQETHQLESEVNDLLEVLGDVRVNESRERLDLLDGSEDDLQDRLSGYRRELRKVLDMLD